MQRCRRASSFKRVMEITVFRIQLGTEMYAHKLAVHETN